MSCTHGRLCRLSVALYLLSLPVPFKVNRCRVLSASQAPILPPTVSTQAKKIRAGVAETIRLDVKPVAKSAFSSTVFGETLVGGEGFYC